MRLRSPTLETAMQIIADRPDGPSAIRSDLGAIFISLELSRSTWLITSLSPGGGDKYVEAQCACRGHLCAAGCVLLGKLDRRCLRGLGVNRRGTLTPIWVRPEAGQGSDFDFDLLPGVVIFELRGAQIAERRVDGRLSCDGPLSPSWLSPAQRAEPRLAPGRPGGSLASRALRRCSWSRRS